MVQPMAYDLLVGLVNELKPYETIDHIVLDVVIKERLDADKDFSADAALDAAARRHTEGRRFGTVVALVQFMIRRMREYLEERLDPNSPRVLCLRTFRVFNPFAARRVLAGRVDITSELLHIPFIRNMKDKKRVPLLQGAVREVGRYCGFASDFVGGALEQTPENIALFWRLHRFDLPHLADVARIVMTCPVTSASAERLFSVVEAMMGMRAEANMLDVTFRTRVAYRWLGLEEERCQRGQNSEKAVVVDVDVAGPAGVDAMEEDTGAGVGVNRKAENTCAYTFNHFSSQMRAVNGACDVFPVCLNFGTFFGTLGTFFR